MAKFVKGDVVVVPFPFSDLTQSKRHPALVIAGVNEDDLILCQITSQTVRDNYAVPLNYADFVSGGLKQMSNIRPNRIFTADSHIVLYKAGALNVGKTAEVVNAVVNIIKS
ncbi:type II toxin-antitoxin system PemK/MazF family toxin [Candidatus Magnetominusculus xianensis]|uniref:mRNA interferase PemK n=1 Tax=Candidatus Magnetominusculus xianensis TaxID=1748249 RepID=A0ABR5SM57_9BACT|nr:type II toxin-antitoxin system PemK/MazF family toxin [Candidatus Magnetominusculus xianensis]KWT92176.1 mRNA interferase PemK [Candidatus Magnetominusculus xianensis]MBF0404653.1 type II toxin-antitoxin system PemK/MazF family toxin [Nitrospirota bacterium]